MRDVTPRQGSSRLFLGGSPPTAGRAVSDGMSAPQGLGMSAFRGDHQASRIDPQRQPRHGRPRLTGQGIENEDFEHIVTGFEEALGQDHQ